MLTCKMQYSDAKDFEKITAEKKLTISPAADTAVVSKNKNAVVEEMIALYESTEIFEEILNDVDAGNYERAKIKTDSTIRVLKIKQQYLPSEKLRKQEQNLSAYSKEMENVKTMRETDRKMYQKSNKSANYILKKGKEKE